MNHSDSTNSPLSSSSNYLIQLNNINVILDGKPILSKINWTLRPNEHWAFIGGNGAGKTTLVRLIRGELWPAPGDGVKRLYHLDGREQTAPIGVREKIPIVSADLQDSYTRNHWNPTGEEVIYTGFKNSVWLFQQPDKRQREQAERLMESLGVTHLRDRPFLTLSRGEARKILMARALVTSPSIIILDEFCNGLDFSTRREMFAFLEEITRNGTQLIYITHRLEELIPSITHALILENGRIAQQGEKEQILGIKNTPVFQPAQKSSPSIRYSQQETSFIPTSNPIITIKNADVYRKDHRILRQINWQMRGNENWAVLGKNGSGKSTFLSLLYGSLHPALGGEIVRFGHENSDTSVWEIRQQIGFLSAHLQADYEYNLTGEETILSGFFSSVGLWDEINDEMKQDAHHWIEYFGLEDLAGQSIHTLSYGQFRKILLARSLVHHPKILLLDEPCNGLDWDAKTEFLYFLNRLAQTHIRLVFVTHHQEELIPSITHTLVFDEGRIIEQGRAGEIRNKTFG